jgi:hypothetical protein
LIEEVEKLDERFATQRLIFYGSSAERTKLFQLDEFDFLVVLSHFVEEEAESGHRVIYVGEGQSAFLSQETANSESHQAELFIISTNCFERPPNASIASTSTFATSPLERHARHFI